MKRERQDSTEQKATKKRRTLPTNYELHERLRVLGLPVSGTKKVMMKRLALYRLRKAELIKMIDDLVPNVHMPKIMKKELVVVIPKIEEAQGMFLEDLKAKVKRNHHYVEVMPAESAEKEEWEHAYAEALIFKRVGLHAESDEEGEIDLMATKKDLLHHLNNIDPSRIHFSPSMKKADLVHAYSKYILHPRTMTKKEIRAELEDKYPHHVPLAHAKKSQHILELACAMFHDEFGGKIIDDPTAIHVSDLKNQLESAGVKIHPHLDRHALEELYMVFVYDRVGHMTKRDIRDFLNHEKVGHTLTNSNKKSEHIEAFHNFFRAKHNIPK